MRHRLLPTVLAAALALAACSSRTAPDRTNFAKALSPALGRACVTVDPHGLGAYPTSRSTFLGTFASRPRFNALVSAGLLVHKAPDVYALSAAGTRALQSSQGTAFCAARYKLDRVIDWTKPHSNFLYEGATTSEVTYTYSPTAIAPWARSAAITRAFPSLRQKLSPKHKAQATLVLKNDGWRVDSLGIFSGL